MKIAFGGVLTGAGFVATFFPEYSTLVGRHVGLTSGEMLIAGIIMLVSGLILIFLDAGSAIWEQYSARPTVHDAFAIGQSSPRSD